MVWVVLEPLEAGMTWAEIVAEWPGKATKAVMAGVIGVSGLVVKHEPFRGFHVCNASGVAPHEGSAKARCSGLSRPRRTAARTAFISPRSNAAVSSHKPGKTPLRSRPSEVGTIS